MNKNLQIVIWGIEDSIKEYTSDFDHSTEYCISDFQEFFEDIIEENINFMLLDDKEELIEYFNITDDNILRQKLYLILKENLNGLYENKIYCIENHYGVLYDDDFSDYLNNK